MPEECRMLGSTFLIHERNNRVKSVEPRVFLSGSRQGPAQKCVARSGRPRSDDQLRVGEPVVGEAHRAPRDAQLRGEIEP